jgi:electron transfer flavoprotein alpha subunit
MEGGIRMSNIVVFLEQREGKLKKASLEAISEGRRLTDKTGGKLIGILIGHSISSLTDAISHFAPDKLYIADNPILEKYSTDAYVSLFATVIEKEDPSIILFPATAMGKDLSPRIAARLKTGLATDCTGLDIDDQGNLVAIRPMYAGKAIATVSFSKKPQIASLRPNVFTIEEKDGAKPEIITMDVPLTKDDIKAQVVDLIKTSTGTVDLTEAEVIISGGRGVKCSENFEILQKLVDVLKGALGASRSAVDAGWIDHQYQVGQTGKVVSPQIYIACGISGAIQHLAGMSSSKYIIAINKDPDAPIFKVADFGIVGDLFQVVPALTEKLKATLND